MVSDIWLRTTWKTPTSAIPRAAISEGARCSSVVRAFAHGAMDRRIDPSWWTH